MDIIVANWLQIKALVSNYLILLKCKRANIAVGPFTY